MKENSKIIKAYLFTFAIFVITLLFIYFFAKNAPQFYTGFDEYTDKNISSIIADIIFFILLSANLIGVILCTFYTYKAFFNKSGKKDELN